MLSVSFLMKKFDSVVDVYPAMQLRDGVVLFQPALSDELGSLIFQMNLVVEVGLENGFLKSINFLQKS